MARDGIPIDGSLVFPKNGSCVSPVSVLTLVGSLYILVLETIKY